MLEEELNEIITNHLIAHGYKQKKIDKFSYKTRFYHDIGIMGDTAEEWLYDLKDQGVDLSSFRFDDYFPPEFPPSPMWRSIVSMVIPFIGVPHKPKDYYQPLTLKMIEEVLIAKDWNVILKNA